MTNRAGLKRAGLTSPSVSTTSAQHPSSVQQLTPEFKISASCIALSPGFIVHFAVFTAQHASQSHLDIDLARRKAHESYSGCAIENSLLTHSHITKDEAALWVFVIEQGLLDADGTRPSYRLRDLELHGLTKSTQDRFSYAELYPCSTACSSRRIPCPNCLRTCSGSETVLHSQTLPSCLKSGPDEATSTKCPTLPQGRSNSRVSAACHLPRIPLRQPFAFFLNAVQERIINDVCENAHLSGKIARRLRSGILWGLSSLSSNWGDGWEQHDKTRPLTFTRMDIALFPSGIFVRPQARPTHFLPFLPSLSFPPGTPINLLPFSTPAYYLNMYSGPTSALLRQFQANLVGLGAGDLLPSKVTVQVSPSENAAQFVIVWISVQNKQGEEKGMMAIWPALLCVSLMSMPEVPDDPDCVQLFAYNRRPLAYIPELPLALQASPIPAPATVPPQYRATSPQDTLVSPSLFTPVGRRSFSRETSPSTPFPIRAANHLASERPPLTRATSSFSAEATQAFRTLAISHLPPSGLRNVADGVGKFVDFMAKERERERERIKKEKEAAAQAQKGADLQQTPGVVLSNGSSNVANTLQASTVHDLASLTPEYLQITPSIMANTESLANPPLVEIHQHHPVPPSQPSYPSPPEEAVKGEKASSLQNNGALGAYAPEPPSYAAQQSQAAPSETFDSFDSMDKFMMDLGMDLDMPLPSSTGHRDENIKADFDSMVFTDDDFSFFDDPAALPVTVPDASIMSSDEALKSHGIPTLRQDALLSTVPDSAQSLISAGTPSPWASRKPTEEIDSKDTAELAVPDLLPGSPDGSTTSSLGPATPDIITTSGVQARSSETHTFDPIRFSKRFHSADAKYVIGKFSGSFIEQGLSSRESSATLLWKMSYAELTDPRIDIVKKLIGMKRRMSAQGMRLGPPSPPFQETRIEWESCADDDASVMDIDSDKDSDEEYQNCDDDGIDYDSRPSTPLASHLPLGPTLLSTQFQHSLLLPLSVNLRPSGASFAADMASPLPNPVPTPVSPAAVAGSTSEKAKSLELVVRAFASEAVENALWGAAWRANSIGQTPIWKQDSHIEHVDEPFDESYILSAGWIGERMSIDSFSSFASSGFTSGDVKRERNNISLQALEQPMLTVGKADGLIQISPPALRFWSKMGLTPRSGPKDVLTFALYEDTSKPASEVENWLSRVSSTYNAKGYGTHSLGKSKLCTKDGLIPVRHATFRKTLSSLINSVGTTVSALLIYIVTPNSILSMSSPVLRQIFLSISRVLTSHDEHVIRFQLVPDFFLNARDDITFSSYVEMLVDNVYERIPRPVDRYMSRSLFVHSERTRKHFEAPSFTLGRSPSVSTSLSFRYPSPDLGLLDRHILLHVGYRLTKCRKWLVAACIDQRGEGHDLGVWLVLDESDYKQHVSHVWNFAMEFARRANVEWRIALAKLGTMDEAELGAWNALLNDELSADHQTTAMHVSILCVDDESGWSVIMEENHASQRPPSGHESATKPQGQLFSSTSSTYILPSLRYPLPSPSPSTIAFELGTQQFIPEDDESTPHSADRLLPLHSSALITVPASPKGTSPRAQFIHLLHATAFPGSSLTKTTEETHDDICRNYHELAVLTLARWRFHVHTHHKSPLPFHLAALHIVDSSLESSELVTE